MKKFVFILVILFTTASLTSCGSKKKGCGLTGNIDTITTQEVVIEADVAE